MQTQKYSLLYYYNYLSLQGLTTGLELEITLIYTNHGPPQVRPQYKKDVWLFKLYTLNILKKMYKQNGFKLYFCQILPKVVL